MANTKFQFKRTTVSGRLPNTTNSANSSYIDAGEFAINLTDGKVISSNGTVTFEIGANLSSLNLAGALTANGSNGSAGQVLTSNESGVYWSTVSAGGAGVNTDAQYTWTNTQTFSANVIISNSAVLIANGSFGTNNQVLISNGTGMYWGNVAIATVNTSIVTYTYNIASNTTVITGADNNSNTLSYYIGLESVYLNGSKLIAANDYTTTSTSTITLSANAVANDVVQIVAITPAILPLIYANVTLSIGNSTVNTTINSTAFSGTANNANNLGGISLSTLQSQITDNAATAYSNAVANAGWYADQAYSNAQAYSANASNLGNGTVAPDRLGSGTANSTTILYGNSVWAAAPDGVNTAFQYTFTNTISFSSNVSLVSGNGTNQLLLGTINTTSIGVLANSTVLTIGNSSVNTTVNATSFSGTANNANNLGGTSLATLQNQITGNAATAYTNATSYADTIAGTAYSNAVTNASYMAAQAYSNAVANAAAVYQTTAGLSANVLLLSSNSATYLGNSSGTIGNITNWITGNAATAYSNAATNASYMAATAYSNAITNASYMAAQAYSNAVANASWYASEAYNNAATNAAYMASQAYTNAVTNAAYLAGQAYSNAVANAAAVYQTTAGLSANVLVLTSNAAGYLSNSSGTLTNIQNYITGNAATAYTNAAAKAADAYTNATIFAANASTINSGTVSAARLGIGTTDSTTVLYGNGVWAVPPPSVNLNAQYTWTNTHTFSANVSLVGGTIANTPVYGTDIVNKTYADAIATGVNFHPAVKLTTTVSFDSSTATYDNGPGANGVGATITDNSPYIALSLDGVTASANDRILMRTSTNTAWNGVYVVSNTGSGSYPWIITRSYDYDQIGAGTNEIDKGDLIYVTDGSTLAGTAWVENSDVTAIGTDPITFVQFSSKALYQLSAGNGLYWSTGGAYDGSAASTIAVNSSYVATLTSNAATYLANSTGTLSNITGWITGNAATAYTNATIIASNGSNITTGIVGTAYLGSGTANSSTILYGNSVWAAAPSSTNASALITGTVNTAVLGSGTANSTTILYGNNVWSAPPSSTLISQQFTANGSSAVFTISGGYASNQLLVFVNGVKQIPTTDVDLSSGTTITLTQTPLNGYIVDVFGYSPVASYSVTGTANTTTYLGNSSGTIGNITSWISGNASTAYTNGTSYADTKAATAYTNATSYADTKAATAYTNATSYADNKAITTYANATGYADTKAQAEGATAYTNAISYADTKAATAYANAATLTSNASNLTTGTLATARLPATANIATLINVGANVNLSTSALTVGNSTVNSSINATTISTGNATVNSSINATSLTVGSNVATFGTAVYYVANGNVGIGTSSPISKLHIGATTGVDTMLRVDAGYASYIKLYGNTFPAYNFIGSFDTSDNEHWYIGGAGVANTLIFRTAATTERMRITSTGNVGIGNTAPGSLFTVSSGISSFEAMIEKATVSATAATGNVHLDVLTQSVLYYTSNATANCTVNIRANSTVTANSILVNGQSLTVAFLNTTGATAYYPNVFSIDSTTVTPKWSGGTAPTGGNANSVDVYTYTIIKTANSTYTVLANQTQYK